MSTENLNTDAERAEFEAAFESMFFSSCFEREADGSYAGRGLQGAWLGWQKARAAQPAPVVPEGYVLVPVEPTEAMRAAYEMSAIAPMGPISIYGYRAMLAAAPAQGQQVDHSEQSLGMAQHARDSAELRRLCAERDEAKRQVATLRQHKTDYMEAAEGTRKALEAELSTLKAQQVGQGPELTVWYGPMPESNGKSNFTAVLMRKGGDLFDGLTGGMTIARSEYPDRVRYEADRMRFLIGELKDEPCILDYDADAHSGYTSPQPAPAQDVALLAEHAATVVRDLFYAEYVKPSCQDGNVDMCKCWSCAAQRADEAVTHFEALAARDKQSGEVKP